MRQLFNWRFVAAVIALAALAMVARAILADDGSIDAVIDAEPIERRIDLAEPIESVTASDGFALQRNGLTTGYLDVALGADRVARIVPGTYGEIGCDVLTTPSRCAILADLLGDAVVWFALVPQAPRATVELPPIVDLADGYAVLTNGWRIAYAPVITRDCEGEDIPTFSDFLRRFGPESVTVLDLDSSEVVSVRCATAPD